MLACIPVACHFGFRQAVVVRDEGGWLSCVVPTRHDTNPSFSLLRVIMSSGQTLFNCVRYVVLSARSLFVDDYQDISVELN